MPESKENQKLIAVNRLLAENTVSNLLIYERKGDKGETEIMVTYKGSFVQLMGLLECIRINLKDDFRARKLNDEREAEECPT